ncbi:DUF6892 domain-containing protein [Sungkyunkwania multivorans]|uniref:DUF6892 domain-containing protein n=1 Tax=Sungkyunkwania multivorans TaxID=1173618 RepID=A0ABW3CUT9_9FLAO
MISIRLSQDNFSINDSALQFPIDIRVLENVLSAPKRAVKKKYNTIYTWDELGVLAYSKNGKAIESLVLELKEENFDFSPQEIFKGAFFLNDEEATAYYSANKNKRVKRFDHDPSGVLVLNNISVWFDLNEGKVEAIEITTFKGPSVKEIPRDKYIIKEIDEEQMEFVDFGFKLCMIQELMYIQQLLVPKFDLFEFVIWYDQRDIDLEKEGYDPIPEVTQYFKQLPIPKRLANAVTEIYQDGGNSIYMQLLRFGEGWEHYWDIETAEDAKQFPNLKNAVLCYAKNNVIDEFKHMGIKARWL